MCCITCVYRLSLFLVLIKASYGYIYAITNILPVAICCCLDTCNVYVVLLTLFCIIVHKLSWSLVLVIGTFSLIFNLLPEAICYCLQTC